MQRRSKGDGSLVKRKDGRWQGSIVVEGKRRKYVYGHTRAEANKKLQRAKAELHDQRLILDAPTVETWLRHWRDEIAVERVRPSTLSGYNTYIEQHIIPRIGRHRLDRLEPSHVRQMYAAMRRECPDCPHTPRHGLAEASVRQTHAILSRALRVAEREGKLARNPCERIDPPKTTKNPRLPLTVAQARAVLAAAEDDPQVSRWYAALWLGLRQGEALGLLWEDVDLDAGCLWVRRALQRVKGKGLVFVEPKSRTSVRRVPLPPMVLSRLTVHRAAEANAGRLDGVVWGNNGAPTDPAKDYKRWGALLDKAKVPRVALHAARNTTASLLHDAGVDSKTIAEILGHATVQVAEDHYIRGSVETQQAAMLAL